MSDKVILTPVKRFIRDGWEIVKGKDYPDAPSSNYRYYAGIGSRKTPMNVCRDMKEIARQLEISGFILRSGRAKGADTAFEDGVFLLDDHAELFTKDDYLSPTAYELAKMHHPAWKSLSEDGKKLITRNGYQVLGKNLDRPVEVVICWTPAGSTKHTIPADGGTGQAIRIAYARDIPVINMKNPYTIDGILNKVITGKYES